MSNSRFRDNLRGLTSSARRDRSNWRPLKTKQRSGRYTGLSGEVAPAISGGGGGAALSWPLKVKARSVRTAELKDSTSATIGTLETDLNVTVEDSTGKELGVLNLNIDGATKTVVP